jgi:hypothetical protein
MGECWSIRTIGDYAARPYGDEHHDCRNYIGAIAAALYDTVAIMIPYPSWKPKAWFPSQAERNC